MANENAPNGGRSNPQRGRRGILGEIRNPLVFSALALLIIESTIAIAVRGSGLESRYKFYVICIMAALFLIVFVIVMVITFWRPEHLYEISEGVKQLKSLVRSSLFKDTVEDTIVKRVKPECLQETQEETKNHEGI